MSKKILALALAGLFAFSFTAKAVTVEELQAQIQALLAQITALQAQLGGATTGGVCFNVDLKYGMTSDEVKKLQTQLKLDPTVYPEGLVTGYFGPLTLKAVKAFQTKYGITPVSGFVGPLTRAKLNALYCTPVTPTTTAAGVTTTTTTIVAATEGTLTVTQNPLPSSGTVTVYGGDVQKEVAAYKIKATNSDVRVKRLMLQFGLTSDFPWRDLSAISLWDGSTLLKEIPATSANFNEDEFAKKYTMTFDGLDVLVAKDTEKVISVKVTAVSVPQYKGNITLIIPALGVRGVDTAGLSIYAPSTALTAHTFATAAAQAPSISVTAAVDNPQTGNAIADVNNISRVDLLKLAVKLDNISMTWKGGQVQVTQSVANTVSAVELYDGSTLIASATGPGANTTATACTFGTFTLPQSAGTTKVLTVKGVIKANPTANTTVSATLPATTGLTGVDGNNAAQNNGATAVTGNTIYLYTQAPTIAFVSSTVTVKGSNSQTHPNDLGDTAITFSVKANGGDIYIPQNGNTTAATGMVVTAVGTASGTLPTTSTTWICSYPAIAAGSATNPNTTQLWRIPDGQTANCTVSTLVTNTNGAPGYFHVRLDSLKWDVNNTDNAGVVTQNWGLSDIKTANFYLGV